MSPCNIHYVLRYLRQLPEHGFQVIPLGRKVTSLGRQVISLGRRVIPLGARWRFVRGAVSACMKRYVFRYLRQLPQPGFQVIPLGRKGIPLGRQVIPLRRQVDP